MKKRMTAILLCLTLAVSMLGTNDMTMAKKAKLKLNKKKITLYVGQTARLKVKGTKKKVKWKSSKKKIASVSKKGKVKAKKKGTAKITAKVAGKKLVCKVKVKKKRVIKPSNKPAPTKKVIVTKRPVPAPTDKTPATIKPDDDLQSGKPSETPDTKPTTATSPTPMTSTKTASPTPRATKSPKPTVTPYKLDMTKLNWKNSSAYTGAWKGDVHNLSSAVTGVSLSDYTQIKLTLNLYDSDNQLIQGNSKGSASVKLSSTSNDWKGFTDINGITSGTEFTLTFDGWTGSNLYLVVQNSTADIAYIEVTSATLEKTQKVSAAEACTYTPLSELAAKYDIKFGTVFNDNTPKNLEQQKLIKHHFNSMTASNSMKAYSLLDQNASKNSANGMPAMNYTAADTMMDFAKANGIAVRGHALVWDAGMLDWFFREGYDTSKGYADEEIVKKRVQYYIEQVMTHFEDKYPGVIYCWDVVNEAIETGDKLEANDERCIENNIFAQRMGRDYVELSFQYARETADKLEKKSGRSKIKLLYNDFSTFYPGKREAIVALVKSINSYKSDGNGGYVKLCDGVGMQSYIGGFGKQEGCMSSNDITLVKKAIEMFAAAGVEVQVTELAVRNYTRTDEMTEKHADFYERLFTTYLTINKEAAAAGKEKPITSISIWGLSDNPSLPESDYSFKMNGPYCGLFDEFYSVKPAFERVHELLQRGV